MNLRRTAAVNAVLGLILAGGCSPPTPTIETHRHTGADVNIGDLVSHTAAYKGKTMTLLVKVNESIARGQGKTLRDFTGRDVKFTAQGTKGERADLVIRIPRGLDIPEAYQSHQLRVTFICAKGNLRDGNEAKRIESE
jgi:hypothetical protein